MADAGPSLTQVSRGDLHLILGPPFTSMYYDRRKQLSRAAELHLWIYHHPVPRV